MCGRFAQVIKYDQLVKLTKELRLQEQNEQLELNYNLAPTQYFGAIVSKHHQGHSIRYWGFFHWGLIPSWASDFGKYKLINIRLESILDKPGFRSGLIRRRCLIPANGFYEWRQTDKAPFYIHAKQADLIYFAGIYDEWTAPDGSFLPSAAILTTTAKAPIDQIHHRMPVILSPAQIDLWLNPQQTDQNLLIEHISKPSIGDLELRSVSRFVNKISNNGPLCWEAALSQEELYL